MINYSLKFKKHLRSLLQLVVCICVIFNTAPSLALEYQALFAKPSCVKCGSSRPYCGLACLYTVMKLANKEIRFRELVKPEYMGSRMGSSLMELKKAAEDNGFYAEPVTKLSSRVLMKSAYPIILHVKSDVNSKKYEHYILFLGSKDGQAKLLDPPGSIKLVPFYELAPNWDGNGLIISSTPIDLQAIFAPARKQFMIYAAIALGAILMVHFGKRRWWLADYVTSRRRLLKLSVTQGIGFALLSLICGMIYHFSNDEGFLANANATASIQEAHLGNFIPKVSKSEVKQLLSSDTVTIDARHIRDFEAGHLEGAINVPVDANDIERQKVMADIEKDAKVVVYCQSKGCPFAEIVTKKLKADGFSDISIFKGGWNEWKGKDKNNN